jgi:hypothetical protein
MQQWLLLGAGRLHEFVLKELYFLDVLLPAHNRKIVFATSDFHEMKDLTEFLWA